jgi:hypothetical protein
MKNRPLGAEFFHADGRTDRQTDVTKQIFTLLNFAIAPKNEFGMNIGEAQIMLSISYTPS